MPLTAKGEKIKAAMQKEYGKKQGESVLYASQNAGTISGIDANNAGVLAAQRRYGARDNQPAAVTASSAAVVPPKKNVWPGRIV